jgi:23S rRNA pseudouridine2605 synthase
MERLQKLLAQAGVASRRKCEQLILEGRVQVNGETVTTLGVKADPAADVITVDGRPVRFENKVYIAFHKPKGVITSTDDPEGRKVVLDFLHGVKERVFPIGRLDYDTEGLLLLTNDGDLAHLLMHPRHHVPRTYLATVKGIVRGEEIEQFASGVMLEDGVTAPAEAEYDDVDLDRKLTTVRLTVFEGRNRQVRRMFEALSHEVVRLRRISYGPIQLAGLPRGKYRFLQPAEVSELRRAALKTHNVHKPN